MSKLSLNINSFKGSSIEKGFLETDIEKAKKMPIGTISRGRKKVAEGKWVPVAKTGKKTSQMEGKLTRKDLVELHTLGQSTEDESWDKYSKLMNKLFGGNPEIGVKLALSQTDNADNFATFVLNKYNIKDDQAPDPNAPNISKDAAKLNPNGTWDNKVVEDYLNKVGGLGGIKGKTSGDLLNYTLNFNLIKHSMDVVLQQTDKNESIQALENRLIASNGNKFESAIVVDKDGNQLLGHTDSEKRKVQFTESMQEKMKGSFALTHNHPSSSGLSSVDMFLGLKLGIKEMRAIAPKSIYGSGTFVMVNNYPNAGKGNGASFQVQKLVDGMNDSESLVKSYFNEKIARANADSIDKEMAIANGSHCMEVAMHTDTFKQGRIEFFFEDKKGNRKKLDHLSKDHRNALDSLYDI